MSARRSHSRKIRQLLGIPEKANRILNIILVAFILIVLRIWHLAVIQYESTLESFKKPQRRTVVEAARRATIRDRFNIPLAINKVQYQAAILYSQIRQIPTVRWDKDEQGKRVRRYLRREYIAQLAQLLGKELSLDPDRIEDLIHAKASFYLQIPFVIKEDITEREYYRLKALENEWVGIHVQRIPKRHYPLGKIGADLVGYMGAINRSEYEAVIHEMKSLEEYISGREAGEDLPMPMGIESPAEARKRLKALEEKAYTITDYVGKGGVEGYYEEELRGYQGKKVFYSDARGNFLRELPGSREPLSGQRLLMTISAELQEYAERLLVQNEQVREARISVPDPVKRALLSMRQPWIKGGAIVAVDPISGEILAMASHPRFDPNDFIGSGNAEVQMQKKLNVHRWLENDTYVGELWNLKRPLERELYDDSTKSYYDEQYWINWDNYLELILPKHHPARIWLQNSATVKDAILMQRHFSSLQALCNNYTPYAVMDALYHGAEHYHDGKERADKEMEKLIEAHPDVVSAAKSILDPVLGSIPHNYDKVLLIDLCRLVVNADSFDDPLVEKMERVPLKDYRNLSAAYANVNEVVFNMVKDLFHEIDFKEWREGNEKLYLKQKRDEEKKAKRYPKPYIDYLDAKEKELLEDFWAAHRWHFLNAFIRGEIPSDLSNNLEPYLEHFIGWHSELSNGAHQAVSWRGSYLLLHKELKNFDNASSDSLLKTLRSYQDLSRPLLGRYRSLKGKLHQQTEKDLAAAFYPKYGLGYGRSQAYRQVTTQGSIFKLVTSYAALAQRIKELGSGASFEELNPLNIDDRIFKKGKQLCVGYDANGIPIPQRYKGGRLIKSSSSNMGKMDLLRALEMSSNPYFSLLAGDILHTPNDLLEAAKQLSYGARTGVDLPGELSGKLPTDLSTNLSGLYAMAIGQHTLIVTPLQTAVMLSAIANGGKIIKPKVVGMKAGRQYHPGDDPFRIDIPYPYKDSLALAGLQFPLFTAARTEEQQSTVWTTPTVVQREIFMPTVVRKMLIEGMNRIINHQFKEGLSSLTRLYHNHPEAISAYKELKNQMVGKTGTAEVVENIDLDPMQGTNIYTHVWFGSISFTNEGDSQRFVFHDAKGEPELVVVVYLRFGAWGKDAAPVAAQMVHKWREIKKKYGVSKEVSRQ